LPEISVSTGYIARPLQQDIHRSLKRFSVLVCHRRFGKTVLAINELIDRSLRCDLPNPRHAYLAPLRKQAKLIAWDYLKHYTATIPGRTANEAELRVDLPGGRRIYVEGADNPDALRGIYLDGAVLDEFGQMQPSTWREVIRPALTDRQGWGLFIGTPKGRNAFHGVYEAAQKAMAEGAPDWYAALYKASQTKVIPDEELASAKRDMDPDEYDQEFECSFTAAIVGSYYGKLIGHAEADKRICSVPYDPAVPVHTAWDLGIGDSTAIWFAQYVGQEIHVIDYLEASGVGLDWYANELRKKPYGYGKHYLPHDGGARELGTGKTRQETLAAHQIQCEVLPLQSVDDGINAVRLMLPKCWFDKAKTEPGLEALRNYRREWDEKLGVFRPRPLHDWASHGSDAFRALAQGIEKPRPKRKHESQGAGSWMG